MNLTKNHNIIALWRLLSEKLSSEKSVKDIRCKGQSSFSPPQLDGRKPRQWLQNRAASSPAARIFSGRSQVRSCRAANSRRSPSSNRFCDSTRDRGERQLIPVQPQRDQHERTNASLLQLPLCWCRAAGPGSSLPRSATRRCDRRNQQSDSRRSKCLLMDCNTFAENWRQKATYKFY